jgi:sigma-B regulation protein RsbU (phosphoserine phosphatase)
MMAEPRVREPRGDEAAMTEFTPTAGAPVPPGHETDWFALKDRALDVAAEGITIADARLPGRPLIYVNQGFERITGYTRDEALGRNCRFLQGPDTDPETAAAIRVALAEGRECLVEILNYRKDGSTFWNRLSITPVRAASGEITHFIGVQSDVTARRLAEHTLRRSKEALEHDLRMAARVQQAMLPPSEVRRGGFRLAHVFDPCDDLAGDAVGIVPLPDGLLGIYLLDVSGHGVGAALLSFTLSHLLSPGERSLITTGDGTVLLSVPPAGVAERRNRQFPMDRTRQYFTLVYGVADPRSGEVDYVVAGHPPPILLPREGAPRVVSGGGLPIGMLADASYEAEHLRLESGDRIYFYTDGVSEALNAAESEFGVARLLTQIDRRRGDPLRQGLLHLAADVGEWRGGPPRDDLSLLVIERV